MGKIDTMNNFGFIKVAAAIPLVKVADCEYNSGQIIQMMEQAAQKGVRVVVFPELSVTAYTCGDLMQQSLLLTESAKTLKRIVVASNDYNLVAIVGLPLAIGDDVYNCAAVIAQGEIKGIVPKTVIGKDVAKESRWFAGACDAKCSSVEDYMVNNQPVTISSNQLFEVDGVRFGVEVGDSSLLPTPSSIALAEQGAKIIFNLAATAEQVGLRRVIESSIVNHSQRINAALVYASSGYGESTSDEVYAGNAFIAENGVLLAQSERFSIDEQLIIADVDCELLTNERRRNHLYSGKANSNAVVTEIYLDQDEASNTLDRAINPMPFIPQQEKQLSEYCEEVFSIQTLGLMKRLSHTSCRSAVIGISGGLDSTLALLVTVKAFDRLGLDRKGIIGVTMPGFGTTGRTYNNAVTLIKELGITLREISIAAACRQHFADIGLSEGDMSVTFENAQARERTQILMDIANMTGGMVVGTGDMSELALGWATYNGDQMSMYGVNCNIAKTLVRHLVTWAADNEDNQLVKSALYDVVDTPVSPELLPANDDQIAQKTEDLVGPYELHDFFLYNFLRHGFSPEKILYLAENAFDNRYQREVIIKWMKIFFRRFFTQQFKRSASPDGVKVCSVGVSPRGDWQMPSDASAAVWIAACDKLN